MSKIDSGRIWRSLGTFFNLFDEEDRVYFSTFWESFADLTADLWGFAYQVDKAKNIFATSATFERRNVLVQISNLQKQQSFEFSLSAVQTTTTGAILVRGFVPRDKRTFKSSQVPTQGWIRIGVDTLKYIFVNVIAIEGGQFDGYVREAIFTLEASSIPHDYKDSIDLNDSFFREEIELSFRVNQNPTESFVDATSSGQNLILNPCGRIRFGTPGFNFEDLQYESLAVIGDRYVFSLPNTYGPGQSSPPRLLFAHPAGEAVFATVLSPTRWAIARSGQARVFGDDAAVFVVDHEPGVLGAASCSMSSGILIQENSDFDIAVTIFPEVWGSVASSERRSGLRIAVGSDVYVLCLTQNLSGISYSHGQSGSPASSSIPAVPSQVELRMSRTGSLLEISVRDTDDGDAVLLSSFTVSGERSRMILFVEDDGTDTPARVRFDEVVRRLGQAAGSVRLESSFLVDDLYPYRYDTDVQLVSSDLLRDDPRIRSQQMMLVDTVVEQDPQYLRAIGHGEEFESAGVPPFGILRLSDDFSIIYDSVSRDGVIFEFKIRGKLDPNLIPFNAGAVFEAKTNEIDHSSLFIFPEPGKLYLRDLPTRSKMWAPVAQEDQQHVQKLYGPLVDMDATTSSDAYLRRVQGAWYSYFAGPAIENIHIGIHLDVGLPVAQVSGVVQKTYTRRNKLGEVIERALVILSESGSVTHKLDPTIQGIDWAFAPGEFVEKFTPLTAGVEVWDAIKDDQWPTRFGMDPTSPERYNAFGVLIDTNVLNSNTSLDDAIRFALRIKPTWAKMFLHFFLSSGNEQLIVEDDMFFANIASYCEDMSFDEGPPPLPEQMILRMGDGHKMGQGKRMGSNSVFKPYPAMGIGLHMGTGLTMGMDPQAYYCSATDTDNKATEELTSTQVVEVDGEI